MAAKQMMVVLEALAFLGMFASLACLLFISAGAWAIGDSRLARMTGAFSRWLFAGRGLAGKTFTAALILLGGYFGALLSVSAASRDTVLTQGEEKYFCEIDCHLAYSVVGVARAKVLGDLPGQASVNGVFTLVTVRTRFDELTISSHRRNFPLEPSPRRITLMDEHGRQYEISPEGERALDRSGHMGTPLMEPLRPGESYRTTLAFDIPADAGNLRLLIISLTNPSWIGRVLIGDESSLLHKKIFLGL